MHHHDRGDHDIVHRSQAYFPDYSLRSPFGPPCRRSTRFALLSATLHPGYDCDAGPGPAGRPAL
jgi:hypothetical protein